MASNQKILSGAELTRGAFSKATDEIRYIIDLVHEAGLTFVLEEPARILEAEVREFFINARIKKNHSSIKSLVAGTKIKVDSARLNKYLLMPDQADESHSAEDIELALNLLDYKGRKASAIKKADLNTEGKLLSDIIGKVFLCKVGSHDHISRQMFDLMASVLLRKKRNWGADLFRAIAESLNTFKFGRILSLYLCQSHPHTFTLSRGIPLHPTKGIGMMTLDRTTRTPPREKRKRVEVGEPSRRKKIPSHSDVAAEEDADDAEQQSFPNVPETADRELDEYFIEEVRVQDETHLGSIPSVDQEGLQTSGAQTQGELRTPLVDSVEEAETAATPADIVNDFLIQTPPQENVNVLPAVPAAATTSAGISTEQMDELKSMIKDCFEQQNKRFDDFSVYVRGRLDSMDKKIEVRDEKINVEIELLNANIIKSKANLADGINFLIQGSESQNKGLGLLHNEQVDIKQTQESQYKDYFDAVYEYMEQSKNVLIDEFRKGEEFVVNKIVSSLPSSSKPTARTWPSPLYKNVQSTGKEAVVDLDWDKAEEAARENAEWIKTMEEAELSLEEQRIKAEMDKLVADEISKAIADSDVEIVETIEATRTSGTDKPAVSTQDQRSQASSSKTYKRHSRGKGLVQKRKHSETWSPTSRKIILDTWYSYNRGEVKGSETYSQEEMHKHDFSKAGIRVHMNEHRPGSPPEVYFPKPFQYYKRQKAKAVLEEIKKKNEEEARLFAKELDEAAQRTANLRPRKPRDP